MNSNKKLLVIAAISFVVFIVSMILDIKNNGTGSSELNAYSLLGFISFLASIFIILFVLFKVIKGFLIKIFINSQSNNSSGSETNIIFKTIKSAVKKEFSNIKNRSEKIALKIESKVNFKSNEESEIHNSSAINNHNIYNMQNGIAIIWQGITKKASFRTYNDTVKLEGIITRFTIHDDGEFYIDIADEEAGNILTIKEKDIITKIIVGSTRYDFMDLCRKVFKLDLREMFLFVDDVRAQARKPMLITTFPPVDVTFTYSSKENGKTRRTITATKYYKNKEGGDYIEGYCHTRKEERLFKAKNIESKLKVKTKYFYFNEFIESFTE